LFVVGHSQIYLAASSVQHLGNTVQTLEEKMRALNALQAQDNMEKLQGDVAKTTSQVVTSEKQVQLINVNVVLGLKTQNRSQVCGLVVVLTILNKYG